MDESLVVVEAGGQLFDVAGGRRALGLTLVEQCSLVVDRVGYRVDLGAVKQATDGSERL